MAKLNAFAVWGLLKELRMAAADTRPLVVSGPLAAQLAKELSRGGDARLVRVDGRVDGAALLVRLIGGAPTEEDELQLKAAKRARIPVIAVQTGGEVVDIPYVLPTDVVMVPPGSGFPLEEVAVAIAARLGEAGTGLAARLPVLREAVCQALIEQFSRKNAVVGAAVWVSGADFALLTLNQLRLVLRLAAAHGVEIDQQRLPEVLTTIGAGVGFRALARRLVAAVPAARWLVRGSVAYAGTRALGETAHRYFHAVGETEAAV